MTELVPIPALEPPSVLLRIEVRVGVDVRKDALAARDGLLEHRQRPPKVERPPCRHAPPEPVRVLRVHAPLVLDHDLLDRVHDQDLGLARSGRASAENLLEVAGVVNLSPPARRVKVVAHGTEFQTPSLPK